MERRDHLPGEGVEVGVIRGGPALQPDRVLPPRRPGLGAAGRGVAAGAVVCGVHLGSVSFRCSCPCLGADGVGGPRGARWPPRLPSPRPGCCWLGAAPVAPSPPVVGGGRCAVRLRACWCWWPSAAPCASVTPHARATCRAGRPAASSARPVPARCALVHSAAGPSASTSPAAGFTCAELLACCVRRSRWRSRSVSPPAMPYGIRASASARQSDRTGHRAHTAFAARTCAFRAAPLGSGLRWWPLSGPGGTRRACR